MFMQPDPDDVSIISDATSSMVSQMTQEDLKASIKELIELDARIGALNQEKKALDVQKKKLSVNLMALMKQRDIDSFDTSKTRLLYKQKTTRPIGKKTLIQLLEEYYKDDTGAAAEATHYILEHLPERTKDSLVLKAK